MMLFWLIVVCGCLLTPTSSRTWNDIDTYHSLRPIDMSIVTELIEADALRFTESPSQKPSASPSMAPTFHPTITPRPTTQPSTSPTILPSASPTISPSFRPSAHPTKGPTTAPTRYDPYPENDPPEQFDFFYFNYDDSRQSRYGPGYPEVVRHNTTTFKTVYQQNAWRTRRVTADWYWREFDSVDNGGFGPWAGVLSPRDPGTNQCGNVGRQSPIDLIPNGAMCFEHHQIRTRRGDLLLSNFTEVEPRIESNKLRFKYLRRPCQNYLLPECAEPDPPAADFPNDWGGYSDAMHVDFKVPAEHKILGESFDAEMQIFHLHPTRRRAPTVSVLMKATQMGWNPVLQRALDRFQFIFDTHRAQCARKQRRERKLVSDMHKILGQGVESKYEDYDTWADFSTHLDDPTYEETARHLQSGIWNPHDPWLVPSVYFFGYDGSLTEPPCSEWVTWFVIDTPMKMNFAQLEQLKRLIFLHVSPDCDWTSVHYRQSVARPIQDSFGRPVWRCTEQNFAPDEVRFVDGN